MKTIKLKLKMHCASCSINIEKILKDKVESIIINAPLSIAKIKYEEAKISKEELIKLIQEIGYDAKEI